MGECDPPYNIEEWIPNSFDLIAVGVQECMSIVFLFFPLELPDLEMRATGVIGSNYVSITEKVGSTRREVGFHGYIALIVVLSSHCTSSSSSELIFFKVVSSLFPRFPPTP